jgi:hypothetical protein
MILLSKKRFFLFFFEKFGHDGRAKGFHLSNLNYIWPLHHLEKFYENSWKHNNLRASEVNVLSFSSNALFLHWNLKPSTEVPKLSVFLTHSSENVIFCKSRQDQNYKSHFVPKNDKFGNRQTQTDKVFQKKHFLRF